MFMLRQTSVKMAVLLHKQASDRFHSLLTVCDTILSQNYLFRINHMDRPISDNVSSFAMNFWAAVFKAPNSFWDKFS